MTAGTVSPADVDRLYVTDSPEEAVAHVKTSAVDTFGVSFAPKFRPLRWLGER